MPSLRKSTKRHRGAIHSMNMVRPMRRPKVINPVNLKAKKITIIATKAVKTNPIICPSIILTQQQKSN